MGISENANKCLEELFLNRRSPLNETDPELVEVFANFAFDEILPYAQLEEHTRMLVILAAMIASQAVSAYRTLLEGVLNVGVTPVEVKELVYQAVPYVGMVKVLDFLDATNEIIARRGIPLPLPSQATTTAESRFEKGFALQKSIFGESITQNYEKSPAEQVHIQKFLSANCFGDYLTRKGLDIKTRELLTFSMLLALGGCEPQLKSHIRGNLNVGNDKKTLLSVITQLIPYVGYPRALNALQCLNEVIP
jgi:4-carboxymuconolactone decarboxylase